MDVDAIIRRKPQACVVDELAHTNVAGSRNAKRYQDVLEILDAGIHVMTAVNIQHLETLNDAVARATGVRVRETVPDTFLDRADEVINVDVTVEELRNRLREGKIYRPEKVEQALTNFFRKGNLSTLRELALRAVADEVGEKAASYRAREGLEPALIPERVMVCMSSNALAPRVIRTGAAHRRPAGLEVVRRLRRDAARAAGPHQPAGCRRPAAEHPARGESRRDRGARQGRAAGGRSRSPSPSARASRTSSSARAHGRAGSWSCADRRSTSSSARCQTPPCRSCRSTTAVEPGRPVGDGPCTLRTRLLLGLSAFVGALIVLGGWSAWHLWRMSALSQRIIAENYDSVVAAQDMKESLERQDSAGLFALLDRLGQGRPAAARASGAIRRGVRTRRGQHHRAWRGRNHRSRSAGPATTTTRGSIGSCSMLGHVAATATKPCRGSRSRSTSGSSSPSSPSCAGSATGC